MHACMYNHSSILTPTHTHTHAHTHRQKNIQGACTHVDMVHTGASRRPHLQQTVGGRSMLQSHPLPKPMSAPGRLYSCERKASLNAKGGGQAQPKGALCSVTALRIRGMECRNCNQEPPKPSSNYQGPYSSRQQESSQFRSWKGYRFTVFQARPR